MSSLKQKTISGLSWSFLGNFAGQFFSFIIGIILARLLGPREYGLIGMVTIFTILTQPFISSGFGPALIRKETCTDVDFSTVFYFNIFSGLLFYTLIFFAAPSISDFFNEPELTRIARAIGIVIVIDAATLIQTTILTKSVNFKLQTKITLASSVLSGVLGILLAYKGLGVWSLVYRNVFQSFFQSVLFWFNSQWRPNRNFDIAVLKNMFGFSSKLLISAIIDKLYFNVYNLVIAKYFSANELGLFTRAKMFKDMIAENLSEIVGKVFFPVLSSIQNEPERLKESYIKIFLSINFVVWIFLFGLAGIAEPLILVLLGDHWVNSVIYLQLLCFVGVFYPMHALAKSVFYVFGRSGLFLRIQIFVKILAIPVILVGILWGIKYMIFAMIFAASLEFFVKGYFSGKLIDYSLSKQIIDLKQTFFLANALGLGLFIINIIGNWSPLITLLIQISIGAFITFTLSEIFKLKEYIFIKEIVTRQIKMIIKKE